ncbi:MAG: HAD-IA family hydrolase [Saccharothrix sp.]|nr:HAD-IA family hydrolase [Saccharothrix sp.]
MVGGGSRRVVSLERVRRNYEWAVGRHLPGVIPVLKDDAYGHGLVPVATALWEAGARHVFVGTLGEARALRRAGVPVAVTVMRPPCDAVECDEFLHLGATPTLCGTRDIALVVDHGRLRHVDLEVDAGLGRGGFKVDDVRAAVDGLASTASVDIGFQAPATFAVEQVTAVVHAIVAADPSARVHVGGSSLVGMPVDAPVRVGRSLFGVAPSRMLAEQPPLGAASAWLAAARPIESGATIGYDTGTSAVGHDHYELDLGYADGLPTRAVGWEVAAGHRLLRLAAVFMTRSVVAVPTGGGPSRDRAEVLILGEHPDHRPRPVREFADHLGCSPTEALVLPRAPVVHTDHRVCVFDVDGVLRHWDTEVAAQVDRDTAQPPGTFNGFAFALPEYRDAMVGKARFEDWCAAIEEHLAARVGREGAAAAVAKWRRHRGTVDGDVVALLREARRHARVVLLSNAHDCLPADLVALGLDAEVDHVFGSAELAMAKPDPDVFSHVTATLGVAPHQCFFVDDLVENVTAAERAGWDAVLFRSAARLRVELRLRRLCE